MNKEVYYKYFEENILPVILPFEKLRKRTINKAIFTSIIFFLAGVGFAGLFIYNSIYLIVNPIILPVLLFLTYAFMLKSIINIIIEGKNYRKMLVQKVLPLFFEPVAKFKRWPVTDTKTVLESQLLSNFETQEDVLSFFGIYQNTNIKISDTRLTLPVKSSVKTFLFKGTTIQLELPNSIDNHIILISKNKAKTNHYKQINPHIEELNKFLYIFAKKPQTQIVTEEFWEIIKNMGTFYNAKGFRLSYNNNVILIAMDQKYPMQFGGLFRSLTKPQNFDELINRFIVIFDLIDYISTTKAS